MEGGGYNRLTSYVAFNQDAIQQADLILMNQKDLLGNKVIVSPDTILVGVDNKFSAQQLMHSTYYASVNPMLVGGTGGTSTDIGVLHSDNAMKGLYNVVVDRFLPTKAVALLEAGKGLVMQTAEPLSVVQENPQSGPAFSMDIIRFKCSAMWEVDWIDPRFACLVNDGNT